MSKSNLYAVKNKTAAKIKIKIGEVSQFVSFTGGQYRGNDVPMIPGKFGTANEEVIKAIESHPEFKSGAIFKYLNDPVKETGGGDDDLTVTGVPGINMMQQALDHLEKEFGDEVPTDLTSKKKVKQWALTKGIGFPDLK